MRDGCNPLLNKAADGLGITLNVGQADRILIIVNAKEQRPSNTVRKGTDAFQPAFWFFNFNGKRYFNSLGLKKLPSMQSLKQEYATLYAENRKRYPEYKQARGKMIELLTAKNNVERILGVTEKEKNRDRQQEAR